MSPKRFGDHFSEADWHRIAYPAGLADETAIANLSARLRCEACDRRVAAASVDWGFTSARPIDPRS